jgi:hypothetical protein
VTIPDDGETVGLFEPLMVSEGSPARAGLSDLALELAEKSAAFRSGLPAYVSDALADLVVVSQSFRRAEDSSTIGHTYPASAANCAKPDSSAWSN